MLEKPEALSKLNSLCLALSAEVLSILTTPGTSDISSLYQAAVTLHNTAQVIEAVIAAQEAKQAQRLSTNDENK